MQRLNYLSIFFLIISLSSCNNSRKWDIDTSKSSYQLKLQRWDVLLKSMKIESVDDDYAKIANAHPDLDYMLKNIIWPNIAQAPKEIQSKMIYKYYHEPYMDSLYVDVYKHFNEQSLHQISFDLETAIKRFNVLFPKKEIPNFATSITAFAAQSYQTEKTIGIGLDCYLGKNYKFYNAAELNLPAFIVKRWEEKYLLSETIKSFYAFEFMSEPKKSNSLLGEIIEVGKQLYFTKVLLGDKVSDSTMLAYSANEMKYAENYEADIWKYLSTKGFLTKTDFGTINPFFTQGPFTKIDGVNQETPARIGEWIGLKIVSQYMEKNQDVSLDELINNKDFKNILKESKYKPK